MQEEIKNILKCLEMDMLDNKQIEILLDYITNLQGENKRLNNIIDELEKYLKEQVFNKAGNSVDLAIENHSYCKVLDKLNELKGDNK